MSAFDKIIGYDMVKGELRQLADCLKNTEKYREMGVSIPRGLLLEGEPGVGKTLMTMCLVEESGRKAFICRKDKSDGDFVDQLRATFEQAVQNAPSIIVLDDMDKFADTEGRSRNAEEFVTVQSCIDEIKGKDVFVIATANDPRVVPSSMLRHGRFDVKLRINSPDIKDTEQIIRHFLSTKPQVDADARIITEILSGRTSATLETVINEAGILACFEGSATITTDHIIKSALRTVYGVRIPADMSILGKIDLSRYHYDSQVIYHEAGHAAMCEILCPGTAALAATNGDNKCGGFLKQIAGDKPQGLEQLETQILISLAGKAAVDLRYGTPGIGGESDFDFAQQIIRDLMTDEAICGFDLLDGRYATSDRYDDTLQQIITHRLAEYYHQAKRLLAENRCLLDGIAEALAEKRCLISDDFKRIKAGIAE